MKARLVESSFAIVLSLITVILSITDRALGAELHLRESVVESQRDRITATITAVIVHIGKRAHSLVDDCDLHVPFRSRDIWVPLIGELKNACSMKPVGEPRAFWSRRIDEEVHGRAVQVTGVFRIWLEHPPSGDAIQSEGQPVPPYKNSNPDHQVELHPLTQIGSLDFRSHVKWIEDGGVRFEGFGPDRLSTVLNKTMTIQRIEKNGEPYVRIQGTKTGFNHWSLRGRVIEAPQPLADGMTLRLDILDGNVVVPGALGLPAVAVAGTTAHGKVQALNVGNIIQFQAVGRLHLPTILDQIDTIPRSIPLPLEFVLLDLD